MSIDQKLANYQPQGIHDRTVPVLNALRFFLEPNAATVLETDILSCADNNGLHQLSASFLTSILLPMRGSGGKTTQPTPSPIPGYDQDVANVENNDIQASTSHNERMQLRNDCLARDNHQCVISGVYDTNAPQNIQPPGALIAYTDVSHIISAKLGTYQGALEKNANVAVWDSLFRYFTELPNLSIINNIHDRRNAFMLDGSLHKAFGTLAMALEATDNLNEYKVITFDDFPNAYQVFLPPGRLIQFNQHGTGIPLPEPYLIQVHYIIAQVLHASGSAELVDKILDDMDDVGCLAEDGSTSIPFIAEAVC